MTRIKNLNGFNNFLILFLFNYIIRKINDRKIENQLNIKLFI
jgi:hypothetical protein